MGINYGLSLMRTAEVRRGAIFHENMDSTEAVLKNGGTIGSGAKFVAPDQGFLFSGASGARISYKDALRNPATAITFAARFKCSNAVATRMDILSQSTTQANGIYITNGMLTFSINISGTARTVNATGAWNDSGWHYVVGTWSSGAALRIYVDGYLNTTGGSTYSGTFQPDSADDELTIGANYNGASEANNFSGQIKYADVFRAALDADEVLAYATNTMFDYDRFCVCDLPMTIATHDAANNRTLDVSGYNNHATFGDGSTSTTFPTKLTTSPGYSFDGGDHMRTPILPEQRMSSYLLFSKNTFGTSGIFGSTDAVYTKQWSINDTTTTGQTRIFFGAGGALYSPLRPTFAPFSYCLRTEATNRHKIMENGIEVISSAAVKDVVSGFVLAIGGLNVGGVWGSGARENIYSFKHFSNYFLNTTQSMDLDIRARECMRGR